MTKGTTRGLEHSAPGRVRCRPDRGTFIMVHSPYVALRPFHLPSLNRAGSNSAAARARANAQQRGSLSEAVACSGGSQRTGLEGAGASVSGGRSR
jgi:hypothetical protein